MQTTQHTGRKAEQNPHRPTPEQNEIIETLRSNPDIEKVVVKDGGSSFDGIMLILDWVTDSTIKNGTRYIHNKNYTGEIKRVSEAIEKIDGIRTRRSSKTGIGRYTIHVDFSTTTEPRV